MSLASTVEVLRSMPLFQRLDERRLRVIAMTGEVLDVRRGERLWNKGDEGDAAYIVLSGEADVLLPAADGDVSLACLGAGEIVGEMAVLTGNPRSTAIAARSDLSVLRLEGATVMALLREFPELAIELIRVLARRLEATNAQAR